jgi:hypothetical protein
MTSAKKRACSISSESLSEFAGDGDDEEDAEGLFSHGQHKIFGIAHDGGPGGVGSGRGEGGSLSRRRDLVERDKRGGT